MGVVRLGVGCGVARCGRGGMAARGWIGFAGGLVRRCGGFAEAAPWLGPVWGDSPLAVTCRVGKAAWQLEPVWGDSPSSRAGPGGAARG